MQVRFNDLRSRKQSVLLPSRIIGYGTIPAASKKVVFAGRDKHRPLEILPGQVRTRKA